MKGRISAQSVKVLRSGWLWDTGCPGFGVKANAASKVYWIKYPAGGPRESRWKRIGEHGMPWGGHLELTADIARLEAQRLRGLAVIGRDPAGERDAAKAIPRFRDFIAEYLANKEKRRKASTLVHDRWMLFGAKPKPGAPPKPGQWKGLVDRIGGLRLDEITNRTIDDLHGSLAGTPTKANHCIRLVSHMFSMAIRWRILPHNHENPCKLVEQYPEQPRERRLTVDELQRAGKALRALEAADAADPFALGAIRAVIFTGARPGEIAALRYSEIDEMHSCIVKEDWKTKGRTKTKGRRTIPLSEWAMAVIKDQPRHPTNPHVFQGRRAGGHISVAAMDGTWERARETVGLEDVRLSDLGRHNVASMAVDAGFSLEIIGRGILGHTQPSTTKRYAHVGGAAAQRVADVVGEQIADAIDGKRTA